MQTVAIPAPAIKGNLRIFEGTATPTQDQMAALFQPTYKELRAARYDAEAPIVDLADAETKMLSPDATVQAQGVAQKAAWAAARLAIKVAIPKPA